MWWTIGTVVIGAVICLWAWGYAFQGDEWICDCDDSDNCTCGGAWGGRHAD